MKIYNILKKYEIFNKNMKYLKENTKYFKKQN